MYHNNARAVHLLIHFYDLVVQHVGHLDLQVKDAGARLVANVQQVLEALGDNQGAALALALQQRVGGHLQTAGLSKKRMKGMATDGSDCMDAA